MGGPNTGEVTEWPWKDDRTITYGARVRAHGHRHRLVFGTNHQGWDHTRAEIEVERILKDIKAGIWIPPAKRTSVKTPAITQLDGHQSFSSFARQFLDAKKSHGPTDEALAILTRQLGYLTSQFGRLELLDIGVAQVDEFRDDLAKRSQAIRDASTTSQPPTRNATPERRRPAAPSEQPLSNESINEILTLLSEIMQHAVDYGYVPQNPLKVGERNHRFLPTHKTSLGQ